MLEILNQFVHVFNEIKLLDRPIVPVVAFSGLVVIAHHAFAIANQSEPIFEAMKTAG
jgi:hypothetical protein